ncbi:MAG: hypothetical protein H6936_11345 [Burkholderiales bacterium]|nr:hypothetical protein [Burkholderiales bacterium]
MNIDADKERLLQSQFLDWLRRDFKLTDMVTVYLSESNGSHNHGIYCALIPCDQVERVLASPSWDFLHGQGMPDAVVYHDNEEEQVEYLRYGDNDGIEPLVIDREFHGMKDDYKEICEEFRLFHQLYHDRKQEQYIKIDKGGNEHLVAVIEPDRVQIRLKELLQFLAIKEMHLSMQFDYREHSEHSLEEFGLKEESGNHRESLMCWALGFGNSGSICSYRAFSRLLGKRLIAPLPKSKSGFWGFAEEPKKKHIEFVIGIDEAGDEITYTSNPDALANFFGANPGAPNYLTPVHFRKQVLDKYYQQPSKYSVEDSLLRCGFLWSMQLDNHHDDKICAWLGDLGRDLPYEEQLHWRANNEPLEGGVSETYFRRQLLAQFTDSDRPEHLFKKNYHDLGTACEECLGWQLLIPLSSDDEHHFQCVRVPATDEQRDFDELVLGLTKILIDSLNEKQLNKLIPTEQQTDLKGSIARLEVALASCGVEGASDYTSFLRKLQNLRSSSAAHRKGSNYKKVANDFGIESQSLRTVFSGILRQALDTLEFFVAAVRSGRMSAR